MANNSLLKELENRLNDKSIFAVRKIARVVGVKKPSEGKKDRLVSDILEIASGVADPSYSSKGAPTKDEDYDKPLVADIFRCREICLSEQECTIGLEKDRQNDLMVSKDESVPDSFEFISGGLLEKSGGKWFLRTNGCSDDISSDIFVNETFVKKFDLREGDYVTGLCKRNSLEEIAGLVVLQSMNGSPSDTVADRLHFDLLTPLYPCRRLRVAGDGITGRIVDLVSPVGAGQRVLVESPKGTGKTEILKDIVAGIAGNHPQLKIVILLIDARPEESSDYRRSFPSADIFSSGVEMSGSCQVRTAFLALEYAKRKTEQSDDVVLLVDDMTRLSRAFNACGTQFKTYLETSSLEGCKRFLSAARATEEGGSLTIISAMNTASGDAVDEAAYRGLKDLFNNRIALSSELASKRIYPPIDILSSGADGDEKLLTAEQLKMSDRLRAKSIDLSAEQRLELILKTEDDRELWKKIEDEE